MRGSATIQSVRHFVYFCRKMSQIVPAGRAEPFAFSAAWNGIRGANNRAMLWLYLLGIVTFLAIVVRRLLRQQKPLSDELYSHRIAIDSVSSGVAWIPASRDLRSMNPALAQMLGATPEELWGRDWMQMFAESDRPRVEQVYSQMLLAGKASLSAATVDARGVESRREVLLVAVHDHKMRFMGHHCIIEQASDDGRAAGYSQKGGRAQVSRAQFATLSS
jgi:PAS domain S-box-containing protein